MEVFILKMGHCHIKFEKMILVYLSLGYKGSFLIQLKSLDLSLGLSFSFGLIGKIQLPLITAILPLEMVNKFILLSTQLKKSYADTDLNFLSGNNGAVAGPPVHISNLFRSASCNRHEVLQVSTGELLRD